MEDLLDYEYDLVEGLLVNSQDYKNKRSEAIAEFRDLTDKKDEDYLLKHYRAESSIKDYEISLLKGYISRIKKGVYMSNFLVIINRYGCKTETHCFSDESEAIQFKKHIEKEFYQMYGGFDSEYIPTVEIYRKHIPITKGDPTQASVVSSRYKE